MGGCYRDESFLQLFTEEGKGTEIDTSPTYNAGNNDKQRMECQTPSHLPCTLTCLQISYCENKEGMGD